MSMIEMKAFIIIPICLIAQPLRMPKSLTTPFTAVILEKKNIGKKTPAYFSSSKR